MTGNVFILQLHALMYVVLRMEEKPMPYGKLVDTTECMTVQVRCRTNWGRYDRIQLYMYNTMPI